MVLSFSGFQELTTYSSSVTYTGFPYGTYHSVPFFLSHCSCRSLENTHFKEHQEDAMRSSGKWNGTLSITLNTNEYFSVGAQKKCNFLKEVPRDMLCIAIPIDLLTLNVKHNTFQFSKYFPKACHDYSWLSN